MKKTILLIAAVMLLFTVTAFFAGCGKKEAAAGKPAEMEEVVVKAMGYGDNANQEGISWIRIVEAFEKENPNIDIDYELLYDEVYHQKVVARLAAGDVPHFAYMGGDARWGAPWREASQQYDHRPHMDANYYDLKLIPEMGPNGEIWEIPLGTSNITTVLFMNKALVESLGFSTPKTYEEIVAMVPAARAKGLDVISIDGADGWAWGSCLMSMVIARLSGDPHWVARAYAGEYKFNDEVFVDSLAFIARMVDDGVISSNLN